MDRVDEYRERWEAAPSSSVRGALEEVEHVRTETVPLLQEGPQDVQVAGGRSVVG